MLLHGTLVENSFLNKSLFKNLTIKKTWADDDWVLHAVCIDESDIALLQEGMCTGPWYFHLWDESKQNIIVVFKDKTFTITASDKSTWKDAITFGLSIGTPRDQLDFLIP